VIVIVIPARLASTRLEKKLLLDLGGRSILESTYRQASKSKLATKVCVATDSQEIFDLVKSFQGEVFMTSPHHVSGTDRIAELAKKAHDWQIVVNVQGDEPFINPDDIDSAIEVFLHNPLAQMASLYHFIDEPELINNPNNVKVVTDLNSQALYFSRLPIPYLRDPLNSAPREPYKKHIGLYAYKKEILLALSRLPESNLERQEKLEQLRALENGFKITMVRAKSAPIGIDTYEDYQKALNLIRG
jgi:3-deoxy-manno-octulosonate cytidylyltransferase (CMP-KDO synthetase)